MYPFVKYEDEFLDYLVRVRGNQEDAAKVRRGNLRRVSKTLPVTVTPEWIRSVDIEKVADELERKGVPSRKPGKTSSPLDDCKTAMRRYREMCEENNLR